MFLWFSHSVVSDSLWPPGLQRTGLLCPHDLQEFGQTHVSWVYDAVQPSHPVAPFSSCPQAFPASGSFPASCLFASGDQSIRASASALVPPMNIQGWFPLGLTGLISLQSKGLSRVFVCTTVQKHHFFGTQPSLWPFCYKPPEKPPP